VGNHRDAASSVETRRNGFCLVCRSAS
jgi:hypothetical protein